MTDLPQPSPLWPAEGEHPRPNHLVPVWAPGSAEPVMMTPDNAADATRRRSPPWSLLPPSERQEGRQAVQEAASSDSYPGDDYGAVDEEPIATKATAAKVEPKASELERLREDARALGIEDVPMSWGRRRLQEEIARASAAAR